jgi:hypothetical protein
MAALPIRLDELVAHVRDEHPDGDCFEHLGTAVAVSERLGTLADQLIGHFVDEARQAGASWTEIGQSMGVSKQAAQKRFVPRVDDSATLGRQLARFTNRARQVLVTAQNDAREARRTHVGSEHVLAGLLEQPDALAARAVLAEGVALESLRRAAAAVEAPTTAAPVEHVPFGPDAKRLLELTLGVALRLGHNYVGTEHMLLALIGDDSTAGRILRDAGVDAAAAEAWIVAELARPEG